MQSAGCDALIRYAPHSVFTFYAAVMDAGEGPVPETLYDLQRPCMSEDPLSPAPLL